MGSKGRVPPLHLRHPLPGPVRVHPESFGSGIRPPPSMFTPFDRLPPPEVMEQKLAGQHIEVERLVTENQRLAATHGSLRQELAAAQHELQMLHTQIGGEKSEREQRMKNLMDKISEMEAELKNSEPVKVELQQAHKDAQNLVKVRQELISKAQQLTQDLQKAHLDAQVIPALGSELESLRLEYQHCRNTYDHEKKFYNDHLESLQVMEKNYIAMAREVEKLRAELTNNASADRRPAGPYGNIHGNTQNEASARSALAQNAFEDGYGSQVRGSHPTVTGGGNTATTSLTSVGAAGSGSGASAYGGTQPGFVLSNPSYDPQRGATFDSQRPGYDAMRVAAAYDGQSRGAGGHQGGNPGWR